MSTEIPLATILRLNSERVIPIERYEADGFFDRFGYLRKQMAGADSFAITVASVLEIEIED